MYGLDETRVSSHSLRIGGATALAAAGLHEYEIKQMGGLEVRRLLGICAQHHPDVSSRAYCARAERRGDHTDHKKTTPGMVPAEEHLPKGKVARLQKPTTTAAGYNDTGAGIEYTIHMIAFS